MSLKALAKIRSELGAGHLAEQDEAVLREAGFTGVSQFYAAFTWRGWVGYA
jgi:hypothetical protein